jgi:putative ATP-binding cassette transporter
VLSGGEKPRLAFARVLIQRPELIVMDEATAALDPRGQEQLMRLLLERLPDATVISVGHRPELEAFHTRKLVLEYRADGARLVSDESLKRTFRRSARLLSKVPTRRRARKPVPSAVLKRRGDRRGSERDYDGRPGTSCSVTVSENAADGDLMQASPAT